MGDTRGRPRLDLTRFQEIHDQVLRELFARVQRKGAGILVSIHEIRGLLDEEIEDLHDAVRAKEQNQVYEKLLDIAVTCLLGAASIETEKMDW